MGGSTRAVPRRGEEPAERRLRGDAGSGLWSTAFAVGVFLLFLLFSVQVLLGLYVRTLAADSASLAAHHMARGMTAEDAGELVEQLVGSAFEHARDVTTDGDRLAGYIRFQVKVKPPSFLSGSWEGGLGAPITREARVRIERPR